MKKYVLGISSAVALLIATAAAYQLSADRHSRPSGLAGRSPRTKQGPPRAARPARQRLETTARQHDRAPTPPEDSAVALEVLEESPDEVSTSPTPEQVELQISQHEEELVQAMADEPRDVRWARETEAAVAEALQEEKFYAAHLVDAECRSTLCRVELATDDGLGRDEVLTAIPTSGPFATDGLIRQRGDDEGTIVVFFARPGNSLRPS